MKKILCLILISTLIVTSIGCSNVKNKNIKKVTQKNSLISEKKNEKKYTRDNAITKFKEDNNLKNCQIVDCVVVNDDKLPLLKAVIAYYNPNENSGCDLGFVNDGGIQSVGIASDRVSGENSYVIAKKSNLTYVGNGAVTIYLTEIKTKKTFKFKVIYSYDKKKSFTNFKIISE